ncbi:hypothetical protein GBAR_LOCUS26559 [Geodia barretti]|uniref:Uncharacterized protein n=1 Tax=Geodia barretti TaxID=519541 RepID=A0AA35TGV2_GEOBA|nr:hypothetical protein GBAR_LOCUS26559 [Geodia barretti]
MTFDTIPTRVTTIAGDCGNGRSGSFSKYLNVEVMAGDYIAVEVAEGCTTEGNATVVCPFLPVAATTDNTSQIWHSVENRTTRVSGLLIGIKADIYPSCCVSGFESLQNVSTPPLEYQAGLFVVTESIACTGTLNYVEGQGATLSDDNGTGGNIVQYHTCPSSPTTIPTGLVPTGQPLIPTVAFPVTVVLTPSLSVFLKSPPAAKIYSSTTIVALSVALPFVFIHCVLLLSISMLCVLYKRHKTGQGHSGKKQNPRVLNESLLEPPQTDLEHVTLPPQVNSSNYYSISLNPTNTIRTRESSIQCSNPMSIDNNADFQPHLQEKITLPEPNYEFDSEANNEEGPYWEPSNIEEELKAQLGKSGVLDVSKDNIQYGIE